MSASASASPSDPVRTGAAGVQTHSPVTRASLAAAALATLGLVVLLIGSIAKWHGYGNDGTDSNTVSSDVFFFLFSLGGTVAVVCAIAALVRGRRRDARADKEAATRVLIGFGVAVVAVVIAGVLTS